LGASIAAISVPFWLNRVGPRFGSVTGLVILIGATLATIAADTFVLLAISRGVAGLGAGMVLGSGITLVSISPKPARVISAIQVLQLLVAGAALSGTGHLLAGAGLGFVLSLVAVISLLSIPVAFLLPRSSMTAHNRSIVWSDLRPSIPMLTGILLYFASVGMLTNYAGKLGLQHGLDLSTTGFALAFGTLGALPGSALASFAEYGRREIVALIAASGVQAISIIMLLHEKSGFIFAAAYFVIQACTTIIAPLQVATLVDRDQSGRAIEGLPAMQLVGQAIGPLAASLFIGAVAVDGAYYFGMILVLASAGLVVLCGRRAISA
jgi:predicted MFS family arabinose efflux permease